MCTFFFYFPFLLSLMLEIGRSNFASSTTIRARLARISSVSEDYPSMNHAYCILSGSLVSWFTATKLVSYEPAS